MEIACLAPSDTFDYTQIFEDVFNKRVDKDISLTEYKPHHGELPDDYDFDAVLVTGSGHHVYDHQDWEQETENYLQQALDADVPVLGVCYGHQILAETLGGTVAALANADDVPGDREMGYRTVQLTKEGRNSDLFDGLSDQFLTFESHQDYIEDMPRNSTVLAENKYGVQAFESTEYPAFGVQFHPEYDRDMAEILLENKDAYGDMDRQLYDDIKDTITDDNVTSALESRKVFDNFLNSL